MAVNHGSARLRTQPKARQPRARTQKSARRSGIQNKVHIPFFIRQAGDGCQRVLATRWRLRAFGGVGSVETEQGGNFLLGRDSGGLMCTEGQP